LENRALPDVQCAANEGILQLLARYVVDVPLIRDPAVVHQPYLALGTHPDCVERIWKPLNGLLAEDCRWVVYKNPVLAHPRSGVIFALGRGTYYALRLTAHDLQDALLDGAIQSLRFKPLPRHAIMATRWDLRKMGQTWVFGRWKREEEAWIVHAFEAFGEASG
jgi:hypothetical protein